MSGGGRAEPALTVRRAAAAARGVPGVAFLRPGIADLLRGAAGRGARDVAGVQARRAGGVPGGWEVTVELATLRGHRALDVTRAVRDAVTEAVAGAVGDAGCRVRVTVTVTALA